MLRTHGTPLECRKCVRMSDVPAMRTRSTQSDVACTASACFHCEKDALVERVPTASVTDVQAYASANLAPILHRLAAMERLGIPLALPGPCCSTPQYPFLSPQQRALHCGQGANDEAQPRTAAGAALIPQHGSSSQPSGCMSTGHLPLFMPARMDSVRLAGAGPSGTAPATTLTQAAPSAVTSGAARMQSPDGRPVSVEANAAAGAPVAVLSNEMPTSAKRARPVERSPSAGVLQLRTLFCVYHCVSAAYGTCVAHACEYRCCMYRKHIWRAAGLRCGPPTN